MSDRATYLARLLISRAASFSESDDIRPVFDEAGFRKRAADAVAKVLVVELGITDGMIVQRVAEALPTRRAGTAMLDRDVREFAAFLRERLAL